MNSLEIFDDFEQGTERWLQIRAGIPTSSCFHQVQLKPGPRGGLPKGRITYLRKLASEVITGEPMDNFVSRDMERGKEREAEARKWYAMQFNVVPKQIGFAKNGNCGASPDCLIGNDGLLEIKDAAPHVQIERLDADTVPNEHLTQCYGQLLVTGREWVDYLSHCRGLPPLLKRVYRDEPTIAALRVDIDEFCGELDELVAKLRAM